MSDMIERVALAIYYAVAVDGATKPHGSWENCSPTVRDDYRVDARAAIEAMREPTNEMCQAAIDTGAVDNDVFYIRPEHIRTLIGAMIDAALAKEPA